LRTAPCYDRLKALGGVFGQKFGWERANWFAPEGVEAVDDWSFRRSKWFEHVGNEVKNVAENVGVLDMSAFAKARVSGSGAEAFLDYLVANKLPKKVGRVALCHALTDRGGVHSEFTIQRESADSFYLVSAGASQRLDHDWIKKHMPDDGSVRFENITNAVGVLVLAGPKSRDLLAKITRSDLSNEAFPWLSGQMIDVGLAPAMAFRMNFVGELGWELHHPIEYQNHIFDAIMKAGAEFGIKPFGIRAMDAMRLEKSYRLVGTELSIEYAALESGLQRFVHPNKGDFKGRQKLASWQADGFANTLVTLEVHDTTDADAIGNNPIMTPDGTVIGRATSGGYGFRLDKSLAIAMVRPDLSGVGTQLLIDVLDQRLKATVIDESPYDPDNEKLRA
jgi:dimethylglycine dehydrogenase